MTDKEKIENFGDLVNASDKLASPWRKANFILTIALVATNFFWAIVLCVFIWFAYMSPDTTYQTQEFEGHQQVQSSGTEVVTRTGE